MMSIRSSAPCFIASRLEQGSHIEPVTSSTSATSRPVISRVISVRAATFMMSWPKIFMKVVGRLARASSVTTISSLESSRSKSS